MGRRIALLLCLLALLAASPAAGAVRPVFKPAAGLAVVSSKQLSARLFEVRFKPQALGGRAADLQLLLPRNYNPRAKARYPVLYLFHGTSGRASDWTRTGDAAATTAPYPMIVAMPDAGFDGDGGGWFTDWYNAGRFGPPKWESFHMGQLIPWVDANLRTVAARRGRAIAGLSQGGFGAMTYAARHPDRFISASAFSGAVETTADPDAQALTTPVIQATTTGLDGNPDPDAMFGPRTTQQINWAAHDPGTLASNLRGMDLRLYTGNGQPGPLDSGAPNGAAIVLEGGVHHLNELFHNRLEALAIPSDYHDYGPGTHTWPYWARDLRDIVRPLAVLFAHPPAAPSAIDFKSADPRWSAWGWRVSMTRPAREFGALEDAGRTGFALLGSGSGAVVTPPVYRARSFATVRMKSPLVNVTRRVRSDRTGRLHLTVPLGPGNPDQQYSLAAGTGGTRVFTTRVRIRGVARGRLNK